MVKNFFIFIILLISLRPAQSKNIILIIGDGLGQTGITATRIYKQSIDKNQKKLSIDSFHHSAFVQTRSLNNIVTDSAAAATAMATGEKTNNGMISVLPNDKKLNSIAKIAKSKGKSVGIITTTSITHATPAAFYANWHNRGDDKKIAKQLKASNFDLFLGGGRKYFKKIPEKFKTVFNKSELKLITNLKMPLLGLFADKHLPYVKDRDESIPSLSEQSIQAISLLKKNPKGFFLMVEAGRIDHAAHNNQALQQLVETIELDQTVESILNLIKKDPNLSLDNTTVLVTSDHETGGLSLNGYFKQDQSILENNNQGHKILSYSTGPQGHFKAKKSAHTGVDVFLFAWGNDLKNINGNIDNTEIFKIIFNQL